MTLCGCGCGRETTIYKGKPRRFIHNHRLPKGPRKIYGRYFACKVHNHPNADGHGWIPEQNLMVEKTIGHYLPKKAVVHHVDGDRRHNINSNFVACEDQSYHLFIEARKRAFIACGHADWRQCKFCHKYDNPINLSFAKNNSSGYHKPCNARYHNELYHIKGGYHGRTTKEAGGSGKG